MTRALQVEGAEYQLLPRALESGAFCAVHYLLIEWHLDLVAGAAERCTAQTLRNSLEGELRRRCATPPRRVLHEETIGNRMKGARLCQ